MLSNRSSVEPTMVSRSPIVSDLKGVIWILLRSFGGLQIGKQNDTLSEIRHYDKSETMT